MMSSGWRRRSLVAIVTGMGLLATAAPVRSGDIYKPFKMLAQPFEAMHREKPATCKDGAIEQLADQIDWLEHHIDKYGSIVAKHPDVWGESRLMRHRHEYERQMAAQLDQFEVRMNAALRRSDQSFLGMAFALQAAAGGEDPPQIPGSPDASSSQNVYTQVSGMISDPAKTDSDIISRTTPFAQPKNMAGFTYQSSELSLEPTIQLDQMSRYINHLHELRRINEGDDIADSPGYALNLVRIPVSVLPGKHTRKGFGAEITITAEPYLSDELLPTTFRNLVINDLVDQLAYPMTRVINGKNEEILEYLQIIWEQHFYAAVQRHDSSIHAHGGPGKNDLLFGLSGREYREGQIAASYVSDDGKSQLERDLDRLEAIFAPQRATPGEPPVAPDIEFPAAPRHLTPPNGFVGPESEDPEARLRVFGNQIASVFQLEGIQAFNIPVSQARRARRPLPPTRILEVFDVYLLGHIAADARFGLGGHPVNLQRLHLMDVQAFLKEEIQGAYDFLNADDNRHLWSVAGHDLATAIRGNDRKRLRELRDAYLEGVPIPATAAGRFQDANTTIALAWAILVHASLLNDRLIQDIHEATVSKGCATCLTDVEGLDFYHPTPSQPARMAFNEYVKCRWPIRVFALDPVTQDQNVADAFARRRELQVAVALAFASGQINAQSMMRFTRRLEWDMATIALNRTAIAFSHGNDTFGWRFQPRFQTPPTPGTLKAFGETLLGGPTRDADMCQRELEAGIRECTAIVVMPSFVPYATFDVRTNWYKLTNPKCTEISMRETMVLSRAITAMKNSAAQCSRCAHLYREGEIARLLRRVDQLDRELPLQTMRVQIPYENTSGGFEIFNRGITELAPELIGWYGAPGINPHATTTMFLVGDGFSVHDTQVIAGGRPVRFELMSRQLMRVDIPTGVQVLPRGHSEPGGEFDRRELDDVVDVHLATPYGVSSHLLVPMAKSAAAPLAAQFEIKPGTLMRMTFTWKDDAADVQPYFTISQDPLAIRAPRHVAVDAKKEINFFVHDAGDGTYIGSFKRGDVPFSAAAYEYYLTGADLIGLARGTSESLKTVMQPYLKHKKGGNVTVNVSATLGAVPVQGRFQVAFTKTGD